MKLDFEPYRPKLYKDKGGSATKPKAPLNAKPKQPASVTPIVAPSVGTSTEKDALALLEKIRAQTRERVRRCRAKKFTAS